MLINSKDYSDYNFATVCQAYWTICRVWLKTKLEKPSIYCAKYNIFAYLFLIEKSALEDPGHFYKLIKPKF